MRVCIFLILNGRDSRFAGQSEGQGNSKVPSVVCYDQYGTFIAAGSEADPETNPLLFYMNGVRRAEWSVSEY